MSDASVTRAPAPSRDTNVAQGQGRRQNLRLALVLASVAAAFFAGIVLKYIFFPAH